MAEVFEPVAVDDTILVAQERFCYQKCDAHDSDLGNAFIVNGSAELLPASMPESPSSTDSSAGAGHDSRSQDPVQPLEGEVFPPLIHLFVVQSPNNAKTTQNLTGF
jgi:hypothetical protein